jgi:hypothetical protein
MIAASALGIFLIPMLYVVFESLRERKWKTKQNRRPEVHPS